MISHVLTIGAILTRRREPMDEDAPPTESVFDLIGRQPLPRTVSIVLVFMLSGSRLTNDCRSNPLVFLERASRRSPGPILIIRRRKMIGLT